MAFRSIASLSLSFGLVSIPVRLYSATESASAVRFKLMAPGGARMRQQYVAEALPVEPPPPPPQDLDEPAAPAKAARTRTHDVAPTPAPAERVLSFPGGGRRAPEPPPVELPELDEPVARSQMVKGYEFEKDRFVLFTADELKALESASRQTIDIVSFIPDRAVDPLYVDKAYFLAPDKRGARPYSLLLRAMQETGRAALAKWAWRSKEYVVQVRAGDGGLVLQQLLYADEVRSLRDLGIELAPVGDAELALAKRVIEQLAEEAYDPSAFVDEEKARILAAVERKIAGQQIVAHDVERAATPVAGAEVVDLMAALRASLKLPAEAEPKARKPARRAAAPRAPVEAPARKAWT